MIKLDNTLQPLDSDLTAYANAADAAARRALIGAVGTALEITTALQDLALDPLQPTKISADVLPDTIEGRFTLADATGTVIANNQIASVNGIPAVGNGTELEGTLLGTRRSSFGRQVTNGELVAGLITKLASIPISAERIANVQEITVDGDVELMFSAAGYLGEIDLYWVLTDYMNYNAITAFGSGSSFVGCVKADVITSGVKVQSYQIRMVAPMLIGYAAGTPPFTYNTYTVRQKPIIPGGSIAHALTSAIPFAGTPLASGFVNHGGANKLSITTAAHMTPVDCNLSLFVGFGADAAFGGTAQIGGMLRAQF